MLDAKLLPLSLLQNNFCKGFILELIHPLIQQRLGTMP